MKRIPRLQQRFSDSFAKPGCSLLLWPLGDRRPATSPGSGQPETSRTATRRRGPSPAPVWRACPRDAPLRSRGHRPSRRAGRPAPARRRSQGGPRPVGPGRLDVAHGLDPSPHASPITDASARPCPPAGTLKPLRTCVGERTRRPTRQEGGEPAHVQRSAEATASRRFHRRLAGSGLGSDMRGASMILQELAASAGLAVGLATASCGIAATCGTAAAGASTTAANVGLAASRTAQLVSSQDRMFMDQASQINLTEISLGRYMHAHATTTLAKNLGGIYARDHTAAQASLGALALRLHVTLPAKPGVQLESMVARVEAQKGRDRDVRLRQGLRQWPPDSHRHIQERRERRQQPCGESLCRSLLAYAADAPETGQARRSDGGLAAGRARPAAQGAGLGRRRTDQCHVLFAWRTRCRYHLNAGLAASLAGIDPLRRGRRPPQPTAFGRRRSSR